MSNYTFLKKVTRPEPAIYREEQNHRAVAILSCDEGVSRSLRRCLQEHRIRAVLKTETMLRKHLVRAKDSVPKDKQNGVEYIIPCSDCDSVYIGETRGAIGERIRNTEETSVLDYVK